MEAQLLFVHAFAGTMLTAENVQKCEWDWISKRNYIYHQADINYFKIFFKYLNKYYYKYYDCRRQTLDNVAKENLTLQLFNSTS